MNTRRDFLSLLAKVVGIGVLSLSTEAVARRRRIRFSGRGISGSSQYAGPVLSRAELKSCVEQERQINAGMNELDRQEAYLNQQHVFVNHYSPQSVDNYNRLVNEFNARSAQVNAQASHFNASCANHAYYESDMTAVRTELGAE